jgi:hypothetical protein
MEDHYGPVTLRAGRAAQAPWDEEKGRTMNTGHIAITAALLAVAGALSAQYVMDTPRQRECKEAARISIPDGAAERSGQTTEQVRRSVYADCLMGEK